MKQDFKTLWKNLAAEKKNTSVHSFQYCLLKAMSVKNTDSHLEIARHFIHKAFTAVTNPNKLANGRIPFDSVSRWPNNRDISADSTLLGVKASELLEDEEIAWYNSIRRELTPDKLVRNYSYFFTRQDIFEEYQLVQTAHVALELGTELTREEAKGLYFTCCGVENLDALENVESVLKSLNLRYVVFTEPDIGNQKTAIGVYPIPEHKRGLLRNYGLLRFNRSSEPVA